MIRFYLIDDHPAIRKGMQSMIQTIPEFRFAGEAGSAEEALPHFSSEKIDLLISDMMLPVNNGLFVLSKIKEIQPETKTVFYSMLKDWDIVKQAFLMGANGYLAKTADFDYIRKSLKEITEGKKVFPEEILSILPGEEWDDTASLIQILSKREKEVLQLIAKGKMNREIAEVLEISVRTVESHRSSLLEKLKLENAASLIRVAAKLYG
ncbi:response regulator [Leptospira idonii]|nr:response regulator transcription factor [Leptospira idonii]